MNIRILSLGAGVQSSTLALMCAIGEVEPISHAFFADTQDEPKSVYAWLDWLEGEISISPHPFPIHRVTRGKLSEKSTIVKTSKTGTKYLSHAIPVYTAEGTAWGGTLTGKFQRHCTADFKIGVIRKGIRANIKRAKGDKVIQLFGISYDEIERMSRSAVKYITHEYPLVYEKRFSRLQCIEWMERHGYPKPPRSACGFCPFHSNEEWQRLKTEEPEEFQRAADFEIEYQKAFSQVPTLRSVPYLHSALKPITEIDFSVDKSQADLFAGECKGMCGV